MQLLRIAYKFLLYRLKSLRLHGVHSPFVFEFYQQVILHDGHYYSQGPIENLRKKLWNNNQPIAVTDLGAGSKTGATRTRTISHITRTAAKPPKYSQLLFRIVNYYKPQNIIELGTSIGLTTAYLASGSKNSRVITLEGCPNITRLAKANFQQLRLKNIKTVTGNIDSTLTHTLTGISSADFVFFDGNHRYEPTMRYFEACLAKRTEDSIFVLDDIYWSPEMEKAWKEICRHPAVTISIDLFQIGLIFFRQKQPKQHFTLWY